MIFMKNNFSLKAKFYFKKPEDSELILKSIKPELNQKFEKRSKTEIKSNKNVLLVNIFAEDLAALKASANHYIKLITMLEKLLNFLS